MKKDAAKHAFEFAYRVVPVREDMLASGLTSTEERLVDGNFAYEARRRPQTGVTFADFQWMVTRESSTIRLSDPRWVSVAVSAATRLRRVLRQHLRGFRQPRAEGPHAVARRNAWRCSSTGSSPAAWNATESDSLVPWFR
jgi:hypothetical protein